VIHVTYAAGGRLPEIKSYSVVAKPAKEVRWRMLQATDAITVETDSVRVRVDRKNGAITFLDRGGQSILAESPDGREIAPTTQAGVQGTLVRQAFVLSPDEGIYGLGQHQQGIWNYRGHTVRLLQENREVGVPVILSSKGYSLLWDNPAVTTVDVGVAAGPQSTGPASDAVPAADGVIRWTSEVGDAIDYFVDGPNPEGAIRHYRELTGEAH
jgi:alpha-D-xyloside xylohydrolase